MEDNETSLILNQKQNQNQNQNQDQDVLSAEDLAWADSCLIEDLEISETNMNSLKEALLYILDQHSSNEITDPEILPSVIKEEEISHTAETTTDDGDLEQETEENHDVLSILKQQPFLPNYHDEMMKIQYSDDDGDDDVGFVLSELVTEPLCDDIFKVWDLDIPVEEEEEDELYKQLNDAFSSNAGTRVPKKKNGLKLDAFSTDSLLESLAELSLN